MKSALAVTAALILLALTSCGTEREVAGEQPTPAAPSSSAGSSGQAPDAVPPPAGEVLGVGTVMDTGKPTGPELCLGAIAESYPPQCSGVPLAGWDWATVGKTFESSGDTRWGGYAVQGTYDGTTLTLTQEPVSSALYDPAAPAQDPYLTSCPEPEGGWAVVDDATVGYEDQDAVFAAAVQLPGYAGSFVDQTTLAGSAQSSEGDASQTIVNVLVTEDVAGAERTLREVWGGALCVAQARHTEQELLAVQEGLRDLPGLLSSGTELDRVTANVLWDDGTLQDWAAATYGADLVLVNSALQRVG